MNWTEHLSSRAHNLKPSTIREILKLTQGAQVISFAGGLPAPTLFPIAEIDQAARSVLREQGAKALQYSTTEGYMPLREWIAERYPKVTAEQVQIISGSQQGLDLVAKVLLDPGDTVVVAAPTYMGAIRAFDAYEANYLTLGCDAEGVRLAALEQALKRGAKLIYLIPDFDNPTGVSMSAARREGLVALARQYQVPIFEDNPYGELRFEGEALPSLQSLAPELVIHAGTFSKIMAPGFRLAWLIAPTELLNVVMRAKQAGDLHTSTLTQMIAYEVAKDGFIDAQIPQLRSYYKAQRDVMLQALEQHFPSAVQWTRPKGGMFLWVTLPEGVNAIDILRQAVEEGVAFVPGEPFFATGGGENTLRLSYSVATHEQIRKGVARLGAVLKSRLEPTPVS